MTYLAGVDLAWKSKINGTAVALGRLEGNTLELADIKSQLMEVDQVRAAISSDVQGVAIDAPLVINNQSGQRACETMVGREYGARKASCHTSNLNLFPQARSVCLAEQLNDAGYQHLGNRNQKWQLECYPHPALIEIFGLLERLPYKKGKVEEKRRGQCALAAHIATLSRSEVLRFKFDSNSYDCFDTRYINSLRGNSLKNNEDMLDAVVCLYIAALYAIGAANKTLGNVDDGYIYVPSILCV